MSKKQESDLRVVQLVVDAQLAERDAEIAQLRRRIEAQDATISRQAAQLSVEMARLQAQLNVVPVDCIRRYYAFTHYDVHAANDAGYTTQQFDSDDMWIGMWLESLDGDAWRKESK